MPIENRTGAIVMRTLLPVRRRSDRGAATSLPRSSVLKTKKCIEPPPIVFELLVTLVYSVLKSSAPLVT